LRIDGALEAAARAAALRVLPSPGSSEGLREMLEALKAPAGSELPAFANEEQLRAAWDATWARRQEAFDAIEQMRQALRAVEAGP
jgi:hypothetical protein